MKKNRQTIVITGGGSGGHIAPLRAVVPELQKEYPDFRLLWIGGGGVERQAALSLGVPFAEIQVGKLRRYLSWKNVVDILRVVVGVTQAWFKLGRIRPALVFSTGGFVSVPVVIAAWCWRIPVITHEQTMVIGLANKINSFFAKKILLSFPETRKLVSARHRHKVVVTGLPVRRELFGGSRESLESWLGHSLPAGLPYIYITGGSLGAYRLNKAVQSCIQELVQLAEVSLQVGQADYSEMQAWYKNLDNQIKERFQIYDFVREPLRDIYASANILIGRAGANTVNEILFFDIPAILIPLEPTGGDEQIKNAQMAEREGVVAVVRQDNLSPETLLSAVKKGLSLWGDYSRKPKSTEIATRSIVDIIASYIQQI